MRASTQACLVTMASALVGALGCGSAAPSRGELLELHSMLGPGVTAGRVPVRWDPASDLWALPGGEACVGPSGATPCPRSAAWVAVPSLVRSSAEELTDVGVRVAFAQLDRGYVLLAAGLDGLDVFWIDDSLAGSVQLGRRAHPRGPAFDPCEPDLCAPAAPLPRLRSVERSPDGQWWLVRFALAPAAHPAAGEVALVVRAPTR